MERRADCSDAHQGRTRHTHPSATQPGLDLSERGAVPAVSHQCRWTQPGPQDLHSSTAISRIRRLAQAQRHGVHRRVGYQHSSITPRHLAFHIADGEDASRYLPDCVHRHDRRSNGKFAEGMGAHARRQNHGWRKSAHGPAKRAPTNIGCGACRDFVQPQRSAEPAQDDARSRGVHSRVVHRAHASHHPGGRPLRTVRFETERAALDWTVPWRKTSRA